MIRINQLTLPVDHNPQALKDKAAKLLRLRPDEVAAVQVVRRSIDARKRSELCFSYIVDVRLRDPQGENRVLRRSGGVNIHLAHDEEYAVPHHGDEPLKERPVVIGAGPAGLFAALLLAQEGYHPLLLERGEDVDHRTEKVLRFWNEGPSALDLATNVQFGEGGAGTFSDGKLNTGVKDRTGRSHMILRTFVEAGSDPSILWDSMPHIGTDVLRTVVKNLRRRILESGGEVRFGCRVTDFAVENGALTGICTEDGTMIPARAVIVASGHSARDLFAVLQRRNARMEAKPFAVGLRVQHPQRQINLAQYGAEEVPQFGAAPYKVTARSSTGRGVYSFCMCPGGYVVNASSEEGRLAINGMSNRDRDGKNANSAIIVAVTPADFPGSGPLSGVAFQRQLEERAFRAGGGRIPVQLYGDLREGRVSRNFGDVAPCFRGGTAFADLREVLPPALMASFLEGMEQFGRKIRGFDRPDAILAGVESRTSSPVRVLRGADCQSNLRGLYPCGEGAGYAGGITSAAMDGLRVAEAVIARFRPDYD